jgi:hypothetical protein
MPSYSYVKTDGSIGTTTDKANAPGIAKNSGFIDGAITPAALTPTKALALPVAPKTPDYATPYEGAKATAAANDAAFKAAPQPEADGLTSLFDRFISSQPTPPSATGIYSDLYKNSGVAAAQADLAAKQQAVRDARAGFDAVNARIAGIAAEGEAMNLRQEGRQVPTFMISGAQAENNRQTAIRALPLQIEALAAQSKIAAAQGDAELSQGILNQAQTHLDTMFNLRVQDAQANYAYRTKLVEAVYNFASDQERARLDAIKTKDAQDFELRRDKVAFAQSLAKAAIENGQSSIASRLMALDPSSPSYETDVAALAGRIGGEATTATGAPGSPLNTQAGYKALTAKQRSQADAINNLVTSLTEYYDLFDQTVDPRGHKFFGKEAAILETKLNSILFAAAQAEGTGALQKADREVIEKIIPNPTSIGGGLNLFIKGGKEGGLAKIMDQKLKYTAQLSNNYGLAPNGIGSSSGASGSWGEASGQIPAGEITVIDGHRYRSDGKQWVLDE